MRVPLLVLAGVLGTAIWVAAAPSAVNYDQQIRPLLTARCYACHGNGNRLGELQLDSRAGLLAGGRTHPVVVPGKSAASLLIKMVAGEVPGKVMPARGPRLTRAEVDLLRRWIDQGLSFGSVKEADSWRPALALRAPRLPVGTGHPIDRLLAQYYRAHQVKPRPPVDDATYARRVYLDLAGMLPSPAELQAFQSDPAPNRRERLAERLLADDRRYAEHWLSYWNDMLRNDYVGTGYIDGGRSSITSWLYQALLRNKPYDRFVSELVNPGPESAGFTKGIVWRGVVNASQRPPLQAAQSISQVFLGINLKCSSCHDSFINNWKLADAYAMAGIYADGPLEMVRCDKPTGKIAPVRFLYPELGLIDGAAPREQRTAALAAILTKKENGRLPRTLTNRIWAKLLGRGLVEPVDDMDRRPWSPELLDWLAADFVDGGYDLRKLLLRIVTSRAYQLPTQARSSENTREFTFAGPVIRRMSAEQFVDAVSSLTDVWSAPAPGAPFTPEMLEADTAAARPTVRFQSEVLRTGNAEIDVEVTGDRLLHLVVTDGGDGDAGDWADWISPRVETARGAVRLTETAWLAAASSVGRVQVNRGPTQRPLRLGGRTHPQGLAAPALSVITFRLPEEASRFRATVGPDDALTETPGSKTSVAVRVLTSRRPLLRTRAVLATADALTRALGRPNREQVVTVRSPVATTLQMLELSNGQTLAAALAEGAEAWLEGRIDGTPAGPDLVDRIYRRALGRPPIPTERQEGLRLLSTPATAAGVEDLLWSVVMLPEFQLIY
jgi:hypothetical protein